MSEKLQKPAVIIAVTAVCAALFFVLTDLYFHFFALSSFLCIAFAVGIALIIDLSIVYAYYANGKKKKLLAVLSCVVLSLLTVVILIAYPVVNSLISRSSAMWAQPFAFIAFGFELAGAVIYFLLLYPILKKKTLIVSCAVVLAFSVTAASCWGALASSIVDAAANYEWELDAPEYQAKHLSRVYNCGVMTGDEFHDEKNEGPCEETSFMQVASRTTLDDFYAYCQKVEQSGYALEGSSEIENIVSRTYCKADKPLLHVYFNKVEKSARIITDPTSASPKAASYSAPSVKDSAIYQYALMYDDDCEPGYAYGGGIERCGMNYVIRLADNSLVIIDGGDINQASDEAVKGFYDLCRDITGVAEGEKMTIACWVCTHSHGDHIFFFNKFLLLYHDQIELQRYMYNFANWKEVGKGDSDAFYTLYRRLEKYAPNALRIKPHTGETFNFANTKIEILYTHEDAFDYHVNNTVIRNFNDTSTTYKFTFDGKTVFMVVGDMYNCAQYYVNRNYTAQTLKSDIIQVAHHGFNNLDDLYPVFDADYAFFPQGYENVVDGENAGAKRNYAVLKKYTPEERIYTANRYTYGLTIKADGTIAETEPRPYVGPDFTHGEYFDGSAY